MSRGCGVLLPVFSLPSSYGIGCFSKEAYAFVDFLADGGQRYWQILPLGPTGYGDSPYQSFSTFAGNPYFIDLEELIRKGLLTREECESQDWGDAMERVDYERLYRQRFPLLFRAFGRFNPGEDYQEFLRENGFWLEDYSLYMAIKEEYGGRSWQYWPEGLKNRVSDRMEAERLRLDERVRFYKFQQFEFFRQWNKLKEYAAGRGVRIIGDIPIYVSLDSADVWANPKLFRFDGNGDPVAVAGCPPDAFAASGQVWGNPLYAWEYHQRTGYDWWVKRLRHCFRLYDLVRIDHFRGFESYYSIPFGETTAENGHWEKGPGIGLFLVVKEALGEREIIAEDLGYLTDDVVQLLNGAGYPGMKVLQFAFDPRESGDYFPHNYGHHCVVYTGTHDNNTTRAWLDELDSTSLQLAIRYMGAEGHGKEMLVEDLIRTAMASTADTAIIPLQDYLGLGAGARINRPSTTGQNWQWRLLPGQVDQMTAAKMKDLAILYERI